MTKINLNELELFLDGVFCAIKEACVACGPGSEKRTEKKKKKWLHDDQSENVFHMVNV